MPSNHQPADIGTERRPAPASSPMLQASSARPFVPYVWRGVPGPVIGAPATIAQRELAEEGSE